MILVKTAHGFVQSIKETNVNISQAIYGCTMVNKDWPLTYVLHAGSKIRKTRPP